MMMFSSQQISNGGVHPYTADMIADSAIVAGISSIGQWLSTGSSDWKLTLASFVLAFLLNVALLRGIRYGGNPQ